MRYPLHMPSSGERSKPELPKRAKAGKHGSGDPCPRCCYDLTGLAPDAPCPECELPAAVARSTTPLTVVEPDDLRRLARSVVPVGWLLTASSLIASPFVIVWRNFAVDPGMASDRLWTSVSIVLWAIDLVLRLSVLWMLLRSRCWSYPPRFQRSRLLLVCALLNLAFYLLSVRYVGAGATVIRMPVYLEVLEIFAGALYYPLLAGYVAKLAHAAHATTLARFLRLAMWLFSAQALFELMLFLVLLPMGSPQWVDTMWYWCSYCFTLIDFVFGICVILLARHIRRVVIPEAIRLREPPSPREGEMGGAGASARSN